MKKEYRIKKSKDIEKILHKRKSYGNKYYLIYVTKNNETDHFRLGMSVGKKIGNAVKRNYEKRHIKNIVKLYEKNISNYNVFIIARPQVTSISYLEKQQNLKRILKQLNVWC